MPKGVSQEKHELVSGKVYRFLLERKICVKKYKIVSNLFQSILKTRTNNKIRRDKYISQLDNCFKKLCSDSTDLIEIKDKLKETRMQLERQSRKRCELQDLVLKLNERNTELSEFPARLEQQVKLKHKSERDYGELLRENDELIERVAMLKEQNKALKKEAKTNSKASVE